jgi:hypothetical protein
MTSNAREELHPLSVYALQLFLEFNPHGTAYNDTVAAYANEQFARAFKP